MTNPSKPHDLSYEAPDYSGEMTSPSSSKGSKKQKTKKVYPSLVVNDQPELQKELDMDKPYTCTVTIIPRLKKSQEGQRESWDKEGCRFECDVISIADIEQGDDGESDEEEASEKKANFSGLGDKKGSK